MALHRIIQALAALGSMGVSPAAFPAPLTLDISGALQLGVYRSDAPSAGLLADDGTFLAPRLELSLDAQLTPTLLFHTTLRADRGFDHGDEPDGDLRADEIFLRYTPHDDGRLGIQLGKSATIFGGYVRDHQFRDDAFLLTPLPYGSINGIGAIAPGQLAPSRIAARESGRAAGVFDTPKDIWGSHIWGPAYSTGLTVIARHQQWSLAAELKNTDLSAQPSEWNPDREGFDHPAVAARLGWQPDAAWDIGVSYSHGFYLQDSSSTGPQFDRGDFSHTATGIDARWAHRDLIIAGEIIANTYETRSAGDLRSIAAYLQARWKAAPGLWLAARAGHIYNDTIATPADGEVRFSPNLWRYEMSVGYQFDADTLLKAQYAYTRTEGSTPGPSPNFWGAAIQWQF